jgi:23S rRNA (adenine-N6)-dimethyltransferase
VSGGSRSRWGWYRLSDEAARRLVAEAGIQPGQFVLDLGAGDGALTRPLVAAGARVMAVELHAGRADALRKDLPDVKVLSCSLEDLRLPGRSFSVVANPPFSLASNLVRRLLDSRLRQADLVVPVQVAQRWAKKRPDRCSCCRLPRHAFQPHAPVPTAVLRIRRAGRR